MKQKLFSMLVLLAAVVTGAWAQTETLLTTITATGETTYSETTAGVVTVTPIGHATYDSTDGWRWSATSSGSVTVEAKEGYTITRCVFKQGAKTPVTITTSPFAITFVNGECKQNNNMNGVTSIEVYGYVTPAATGYSITLDEGTGNKDSQNWEITPQSSELSGGEDVTVKYNGSREVKSVTVVKVAKGGAVDNAYMKWDADQKKLVATPMPESFTTVTSSTTAWSAGTYVVEGEVDINGTIELSGAVELIIKDGAKLTAKNIIGNSPKLYIYGQANQTGQLVVSSDDAAIINLATLEVHSAKVTATSSGPGCGGFYEIGTFNVYGGSVEAKGTAAEGGCGISLKKNGSMNIYGGEVKAEGTGDDPDVSYGITSGASSPSDAAYVRVYGGKLWAGCANNQALHDIGIYLTKDNGYTSGKIEYSSDNSNWSETFTPEYVRVGNY